MRDEHRSFPLRTSQTGVEAFHLISDRTFARHTHEEFGIGVILSGGHRSWSGRGMVEAGPGQSIMVNPGEVHDGAPIAGQRRVWRMLYFTPALLYKRFGTGFEFTGPVAADRALVCLFMQYFQSVTNSETDGLAMEQAGELLFQYLSASQGSRRTASCLRADIGRARQRLDDAPTEAVSLQSLASEAGLSRFQLVRAFARELGITPYAYLMQARVRRARQLLVAGRSLADAAHEAGFADQSHMTRAFRRQFGVSPGQYRASLRRSGEPQFYSRRADCG